MDADQIRSKPVTVHMLIAAQMRMHKDLIEQIYRELDLMDGHRQATEDRRSQRRNGNRVLVILVAWVCTLTVPIISELVLHSAILAQYAANIGFTADLLVTGYAWRRRY